MLDIADDCSKDWIGREGPDGKKFRVFDHENFRRSKRQMGALQWRISKLTPKKIPLDVACYPVRGTRTIPKLLGRSFLAKWI
jgi:hypothetical protein